MLVTIIDYGLSNLLSVQRAVEYCGEKAQIVSDPKALDSSDILILPGVGAFGDGMSQLNKLGFVEPIHNWVDDGRPFLGICLGMQMMFSGSEEGPGVPGLGIIDGEVVKIPSLTIDGQAQRVPHVSWEKVSAYGRESIFTDMPEGSSFYFVHSYEGKTTDPEQVAAVCTYGGRTVTAAVMNKMKNAIGCQFHPEKSGPSGLRILKEFLGSSGL